MREYKESQQKAKEVFQERTEKIKSEGLDANLLDSERLPEPAQFEDDTAGPSEILKEIDTNIPI